MLIGLETPPPAWGRPAIYKLKADQIGNTPTCVGKTWVNRPRVFKLEKHPHLRGEDNTLSRCDCGYVETPPPAWGRQPHNLTKQLEKRNTPTCVGKTMRANSNLASMKKHPHLRGEDVGTPIIVGVNKETPPPAWGRRI